MDIMEIRRRNLRKIIDDHFKTNVEFAEKLGMKPTTLSRYLTESESWRRNIGSKLARKMEAAAGQPEFYLDADHDIQATNTLAIPLIEPSDLDSFDEHWKPSSPAMIVSHHGTGPRLFALCMPDQAFESSDGMGLYPKGLPLIVDPDIELRNESVSLLKLSDGQVVFRKVYRGYGDRAILVAMNERLYPNIELDRSEFTYIGKVVEAPARPID